MTTMIPILILLMMMIYIMMPIVVMMIMAVATMMLLGTGGADALALSDCARTTHISHGGEDMHMDLGEGRVMWRDWWSQEGTTTHLSVSECGSGEMLRFLTAEQNMSDRLPFDRTERALGIVADHHLGSRVFATLPRLAEALDKTARDITRVTLAEENCACAALYPELRGEKTEFVLDD